MRDYLAENKALTLLLTITLLLGILPYIPFGWARIFGNLPSQAVWEFNGGNHGPWWGHDPHQYLMVFPMLALYILPGPTLFTAVVDSLVNKCSLPSPRGSGLFLLLLCPIQWVLALLHLCTLFWTVE
ncbi:MAG: hypothetical protein V4671_00390 [Armatimonadota bacterium]